MMKLMVFYHQGKGRSERKLKKERCAYLSLRDGMMKDTKSFVSSLILYIYGRKAEFLSNESKIMFALLEGCQVQQPTLNSGLVRVTVSSYLHCMEVGTISYYKVGG